MCRSIRDFCDPKLQVLSPKCLLDIYLMINVRQNDLTVGSIKWIAKICFIYFDLIFIPSYVSQI